MCKDKLPGHWTTDAATWAFDEQGFISYRVINLPKEPEIEMDDLNGPWAPDEARAIAAKLLECADLAEGKDPQEGDA